MPSLAEYFEKNRPQPYFSFATRVFGKYNKIPFVGTVYGDGMISEEQGPRLTIHLDLPIIVDGVEKNIIIDTYDKFKDMKNLYDLDAPEADRIARASKTSGSGFDSHQAHQKKAKKKEVSRSESLLNNLKNLTKKGK